MLITRYIDIDERYQVYLLKLFKARFPLHNLVAAVGWLYFNRPSSETNLTLLHIVLDTFQHFEGFQEAFF